MIKIVEVGPRDGLQNEAKTWSVAERCALIADLHACGLQHIEVGAFVSPKRVPQMADSADVMEHVQKNLPKLDASVLVPNRQGLQQALQAHAKHIAVFVSASEGFSLNNNHAALAEVLAQLRDVVTEALARGLRVRAYISCVAYCPFDGWVDVQDVLHVLRACVAMGCHEISLGDTTGHATVRHTRRLIAACQEEIALEQLAMHMHDTYGQALVNCVTAYEQGIRIFDSSIAGLGGCPYAPGASGNLATEDLVYCLEGLGEPTGIDLLALRKLVPRVLAQKAA